MNDRIRELVRTSHLDVYGLGKDREKWESTVHQFAELIVRECADISKQSQWSEAKSEYYEGFNEAMIYVSNKIKKHFGVE